MVKQRSKISKKIAHFDSPPIVEVVFGVYYNPLNDLKIPYFGSLWEKLKKDYIKCDEQPPIIDNHFLKNQEDDRIPHLPEIPRVWFLNEDETEIIQIQRDRFLYNSKRLSLNEPYIDYEKTEPRFFNCYKTFQEFLSEKNIPFDDVQTCELTYLNIIESNELWEHLGDINKVFPDINWRQLEKRYLNNPKVFNIKLFFPMENNNGNLEVSIRTGHNKETLKTVLQFQLVARGETKSFDEMKSWFNTAHEFIVNSFMDLTSAEIQEKCWKKGSNNDC